VRSQAAAYVALDAEWQAAYRMARDPSKRTGGKVVAKNDARARLIVMASMLARTIAGNPDVSDEQRLGLGLSVRSKSLPLAAPRMPRELSTKLDGDWAIFSVKIGGGIPNPGELRVAA
jgi:hypothetical protein